MSLYDGPVKRVGRYYSELERHWHDFLGGHWGGVRYVGDKVRWCDFDVYQYGLPDYHKPVFHIEVKPDGAKFRNQAFNRAARHKAEGPLYVVQDNPGWDQWWVRVGDLAYRVKRPEFGYRQIQTPLGFISQTERELADRINPPIKTEDESWNFEAMCFNGHFMPLSLHGLL